MVMTRIIIIAKRSIVVSCKEVGSFRAEWLK